MLCMVLHFQRLLEGSRALLTFMGLAYRSIERGYR